MFVAYTRELDISSCGGTQERTLENLKETVRLFPGEAEKMGTLDRALEESGFLKQKSKLESPRLLTMQRVSLAILPFRLEL